DKPRVVEVRSLPVVRMPAGLLRQIRAGALGSEQVGRLVAPVEVAGLRNLRIEEVQSFAYILRTGVPRVADVAAVLGEEVATLDGAVGERRPVVRRRRIERVNRQPDDDEDDREEGEQSAEPSDERGDE